MEGINCSFMCPILVTSDSEEKVRNNRHTQQGRSKARNHGNKQGIDHRAAVRAPLVQATDVQRDPGRWYSSRY